MAASAAITSERIAFSRLSERVKAKIFIGALLTATVFFYVFAPLVHSVWWPFSSLQGFYSALIYLVTLHVPLTAFIYLDRSSYRVISRHKLRFYLIAPGFLLSVFLLFVFFSTNITSIFFLMFGWWSYWHYQKQHYGVYCFVKSYYDLRSSPIERFVILTATLPAMIAIVPVVIDSNGTDLERRIIAHYGWALHSVGILFLLGVGVLGVSLAIGALRAADGSARRQLVPAALLTFLAANYWPFFFFKDVSLAAAMATGGHGLQYVVFMIVYAYNGSPPSGGPPRKRAFRGAASLVVMFALAAGLWKITEVLPAQTILGLDNAALGGALATLGVSMTGAHYLLDAVLWRLSDRNSRELVVGKYGFLFANRV